MACRVGTMKIAHVISDKIVEKYTNRYVKHTMIMVIVETTIVNCYTKNYTDNSSCLNILYFCICISFWEYS